MSDLASKSIEEVSALLENGNTTSVALCEYFLDRIDKIDRSGPTLRSVIETNPDALDLADKSDQRRKKGERLGPLEGIPILIKDSIDTADRTMTTAGSLAMVGHYAEADAALVKKLRTAGAIILGKANMTEWSYMRSARTCSGWSSRGGQIRNPHVLDRTPSGSSGGSAVAVAADFCMGAIGAEVDGSIVRPASANGIVGIKPTVGLVSRAGVMPVAAPQDTAGPFGRSVSDVARILTVISGPDPADEATLSSGLHAGTDFTEFLKTDALHGARIGVARDLMGTHEAVDRSIEAAIDVIRDLGADIIDPAIGSWTPFFGEAEVELCLYGFKHGINRYLGERPKSPMRSLAEVIRFNNEHAETILKYFPQDLFELAEAKGDFSDKQYIAAKEACRQMSRTDGIDKVMDTHRLDAIIAPTDGTPPWMIDPLVGDHIVGGCSAPPAMAGYPHVSVPAAMAHALPVGLSFFGRAWSDGKLLGYAHAFEQATHHRRTPAFLPTVP